MAACAEAKIAPLIAGASASSLLARAVRRRAARAAGPHAARGDGHRLATPAGRQLYALRKQTPEPVFGIIKSVMGFRQFSLRGLPRPKASGTWSPWPGT